jgi:hypothetical protein
MIEMACGCQKNKGAALKWTVDFNGTEFRHSDGTSSAKTYGTVSEANSAIRKAGATGKVKPKPSTA